MENGEAEQMNYTIRRLFPDELLVLTELFEYNDAEEMVGEIGSAISNNICDVFVLYSGDKLLGELHAVYESYDEKFASRGKRVYLCAYRVHKAFRNQGIGQYLLENVMKTLKSQGYSEFTIGVEDDNMRAKHIYEKYGFSEIISRETGCYQGDSYEYDLLLNNKIEKIEQLCSKYNLGRLLAEPDMVTGGLMHKMYHVATDGGEYAIKELNPDIMLRPDAMDNMINSELISNALRNNIPLAAAKEFQGQHVIESDGFYYMVFEWLDGRSVFATDISDYHCEQIGKLLGRIHAANICIGGMKKEPNIRNTYDWDMLLGEAEKQGAAWRVPFKESLSEIKQWDKNAVDSGKILSEYQVISHRDLDPKNVMWKDNKPYLIDWEAAGYVNPFQELAEVLNYWAVNSSGNYDKKKFSAMMNAYMESVDISSANWEIVLNGGFDGMLGWLEYNIRRALGFEGSSNDDKRAGESQTISTIKELKNYAARMKQLKNWLCEGE